MKSIGFTNTSNEATELIRLQRQALEDKLKADKENKIKDDEKQLKTDQDGGLVPYNSLQNTGGSNNMRRVYDDNFQNINHYINTILYNLPGELKMVPKGRAGDPYIQTNAVVEQLSTPIKPQKPPKLPQPPKTPEVPELLNAPAAFFDIDLNDDETLNTKVDDTNPPSTNIFNMLKKSFMGQNPRKAPKNDTDISNILPTKTRGEKEFDIPEDNENANLKDAGKEFDIPEDNLKDAGKDEEQIEKEKLIAEIKVMTKQQLVAYINTNYKTPQGRLMAKSKETLQKLALTPETVKNNLTLIYIITMNGLHQIIIQ